MDALIGFWYDNLHGIFAAALFPVLVLGLGLMVWNGILRLVYRPEKEETGLMPKIVASIRIPGYILVTALAVKAWSTEIEPGKVTQNWILGANIFLSVSQILFLGEILFATGVDYYLRQRHGTEVPSIFEQIIKVTVYALVVLSFLSTTYKVDITPLLTTSAVFTMVIGLALQDVLGNLFSGISVHISPPFKIGDWIEVSGFRGRVIESNWRATTLRDQDRQLISIPNNEIAKKDIVNHSIRPGLIFNDLMVGISYEATPEQVRHALLGASQQVAEIARNPSPRIFMDAFQDFSISYRLRYWFKDTHSVLGVKDNLVSRIWYRLKRDGITIPFPIRDVNIRPEKDRKSEIIDRRLSLISEVDFLHDLDRPHRVFLAERLKEFWFESGERIFESGSSGTEFYIIDRGRVSVHIDEKLASPVAELKSGDFFGEMSLLTGEPRSASIFAEDETSVLVLNQEMMSRLLREEPSLAVILSEALAERVSLNKKLRDSHDAEPGGSLSSPANHDQENAQASSVLLDRIKRLFRLI